MRTNSLYRLTLILDEVSYGEWQQLKQAGDFYFAQVETLTALGPQGVKAKVEQWEPRKAEMRARAESEGTEKHGKMVMFYEALEVARRKYSTEIRKLLAAEREAGVTPASARVALERHEAEEAATSAKSGAGTASGAGGGWVADVLKYMYEEQELPK